MIFVSKSQIALSYAYSLRESSSDTTVFWVRASDQTKFEEDYRKIARAFQLPDSTDPKSDILQIVETWLSSSESGRWMLIIDEADDAEMFSPKDQTRCGRDDAVIQQNKGLLGYIPRTSNGSVIFTTKDTRAGMLLTGNGVLIPVEKMAASEEKELLRKKLGTSDVEIEGTVEFLEEIGHLPLAIVQAAAFIRMNSSTVSEFLQLWRHGDSEREELLSHKFTDLGRDADESNAVLAISIKSLDLIKKNDPPAADLISLICFLDWQNIPRALLQQVIRNPLAFTKAMGTLTGFSLVVRNEGGDSFDVHCLLHFAARKWINMRHEGDRWANEALKLISDCFPTGEHENWETCAEYFPQAKAVLNHSFGHQVDPTPRATLLYNLSWYLWSRGKFDMAVDHAEKAYELRKQGHGLKEEDALDCLSMLATILRSQGHYDKAEEKSVQELLGCEKMLGKEHPRRLISLGNLASVLLKQGKYVKAEEKSRQALTISERTPNMDPRTILSSVSILASALTYQEKYEDAEEMTRRALEGYVTHHGESDPDTLACMGNLATILLRQEKLTKAEELLREILHRSEMGLGDDHPHRLTIMNNLATVLRRQRKLREAKGFCGRALKGYEEKFGPQNPLTLFSVSNLASILHDEGEYGEAEAMYRQALEGREESLGKWHPETLFSVKKLSLVLFDQGRHREAEEMELQIEARKKEAQEALTREEAGLCGATGMTEAEDAGGRD